LEPPQQPTALLCTLANLRSTRSQTAHGHGRIYDDSDALLRPAAVAAGGNGPIYGGATGGVIQGQHDAQIHLPALQKRGGGGGNAHGAIHIRKLQ
jgi:hypothetical protein